MPLIMGAISGVIGSIGGLILYLLSLTSKLGVVIIVIGFAATGFFSRACTGWAKVVRSLSHGPPSPADSDGRVDSNSDVDTDTKVD